MELPKEWIQTEKSRIWSMPEFRIWKNEEEPVKENQGVVDGTERKTYNESATWAETREEGR